MSEPFRRAADADIEAIVELMAAYYEEEAYPFEVVTARDALAALVADERLGAVWVADIHGYIAGYFAVTVGFSLESGGRDAFLDELYLREGARGRGLGAAALDLAEAWCRERGVRVLHLEVERHRIAAQGMYRRRGFVERDRHLLSKPIPSA